MANICMLHAMQCGEFKVAAGETISEKKRVDGKRPHVTLELYILFKQLHILC